MFINSTVGIWNNTPGVKINGVYIPGVLAYVYDIDVDIQPFSTALLITTYGYNIEVDKRLFINNFDINIKVGTILRYIDKYGEVVNLEVKAIPWDDRYMDVMCLKVQI